MTELLLKGPPDIAVVLRRSQQARRISLRISQLDGRVTLTVPRGVPDREAMGFAHEKERWIRKHLDARGDDIPIGLGAVLPIEGRSVTVVAGSGRRIAQDADHVAVPGAEERVAARLSGHLKELARGRLAEASGRYAHRLGRSYSRLTLRDTRSRWGSCTSDGGLMYSWRLILAPPEVLEYVAAHEVAHLAEMNHSPAFWAQVERLYGPYSDARGWLRKNGGDLHRYRFGT